MTTKTSLDLVDIAALNIGEEVGFSSRHGHYQIGRVTAKNQRGQVTVVVGSEGESQDRRQFNKYGEELRPKSTFHTARLMDALYCRQYNADQDAFAQLQRQRLDTRRLAEQLAGKAAQLGGEQCLGLQVGIQKLLDAIAP